MIKLHDHQAEQIERVRESMRGHKNVLLQCPTGGGKSVMASYMIASSREKGRKSAFVVPRVDLMKQMSNTFQDFNIPHSYVASGMRFNPRAGVHICSLQTLVKRTDDIKPDVVFCDETHWGADLMARIIKWCRDRGIWVIGLSATPAMQNNYGMADWYDDMVQGPSIRWLIDNKFLSDYRLVQPSIKMPKGCIGGDPIDEWEKHAGGRRTVGFCRDKAHGYAMAELFNKYKIPAAFIESDTPDDERKRLIAAFASDELKVLFNVYLMQMGFDLASQIGRAVNVRCLLDLQPTGSLTTQMQKNGRALRYDEGGEAVIIDLAGNSYPENHGFPCADREWVLDNGDMHKRDVEYRERMLSLINCKNCYKPSKVGGTHCPYCNTKFVVDGKKIKEIDGRLVVVTPEMLRAEHEAAEREAKNKRMEQGRAQTLDDLRRIAAERGYKPGWVWTQAKLKGISA